MLKTKSLQLKRLAIKVIDVILTQSLTHKLILLQYPSKILNIL